MQLAKKSNGAANFSITGIRHIGGIDKYLSKLHKNLSFLLLDPFPTL